MKTRLILNLFILLIFLLIFGCKNYENTNSVNHTSLSFENSIDNNLSKIASYFEQNKGQTSDEVHFLLRGNSYTLFLTQEEAVFKLPRINSINADERNIRMKFLNADPNTEIKGLNKMLGKSNYFKGGNPDQWQTDVEHYAKVQYNEIYPGIDLLFYSDNRNLEFDFKISPGSNYNLIKFSFEGAERIEIDDEGQIHLFCENQDIKIKKPHIFQIDGTLKNKINGNYRIEGNIISFNVENYNPNLALLIDPVVIFSTYFGGSSYDRGDGIAVDSNGDIYITGNSRSIDFPTSNAYQTEISKGKGSYVYDDVIVIKIKGDGSELIYSTFIGGSSSDYGNSIAVDDYGNAFITGTSSSEDDLSTSENEGFPTVNGFQNSSNDGYANPFVLKLGAGGNNLLYSSYFGDGYDSQTGTDIAIDNAGNCYILGTTFYSGIVTRNAYIPQSPSYYFQYFVAKFNPSLSGDESLIYSTYLGGTGDTGWDWDTGAIIVDQNGCAIVTGRTKAADFPVLNAVQSTKKGSQDAIITKLSADGSSLVFSTFLGGDETDEGTDICVDGDGNIYVTGWPSLGFQYTDGSYQQNGGNFICKFTPSGEYVYAGRTGSSYSLGIDEERRIYKLDYPANFQTGVDPVNVIILSADCDKIESSSPVTGTTLPQYIWRPDDMFVNNDGSVYLIGSVSDGSFQTKDALQPTFNGGSDLFIVKLGGSMEFFPNGIAYDPINWDKNVGELQSTFTDLSITGNNLSNVDSVIFYQNGKKDVYLEAQNIRTFTDSVAYDLVVVHGSELGFRDIKLKTKSGQYINVTDSDKKFIVSRIKTYFNQAVNQNELAEHEYKEILVAQKKGVIRMEFDDTTQIGKSFLGILQIKDISGSTRSNPLIYTHQDAFTEQEIINGIDYLNIPIEHFLEEGEHTFKVSLLCVDDDNVIQCPDIKRVFKKSAPIRIWLICYKILFLDNGTRLNSPVLSVTKQEAEEAVEYFKKVYPISDDQLKFSISEGIVPHEFGAKQLTFYGRNIYVLDTDVSNKFYKNLVLTLKLQNVSRRKNDPINVIVGILPQYSLYEDLNKDGKITLVDNWTAGFTIISKAVLITPRKSGGNTVGLGGALAHEIGHQIHDLTFETGDLPPNGNNLMDEYKTGIFDCDVNPPINGNIDFDGNISCTNSPYVDMITGDSTAIFTDRTAYDFIKNEPMLTYIGIDDTVKKFNFMGNAREDNNTWVSLRCYQEMMKSLIPISDFSLAKTRLSNNIIEISGTISKNDEAEFSLFYLSNSGFPSIDSFGPYKIEIRNNSEIVLNSYNFDVPFIMLSDPPKYINNTLFSVRLEKPEGAKKVVLLKNNNVLATQTLSENSPKVSITSPNTGETINMGTNIEWTATDVDGDELTYSIFFNKGNEQISLAIGIKDNSYVIDNELIKNVQGTLTVIATDGYNFGIDSVANLRIVGLHDSKQGMLPSKFYLGQNYPNPFNSITNIKFGLAAKSKVYLAIYNLLGEEVMILINNKIKNGGAYEITLSGNNLSSGIYFVKLKADKFVETKKIVLLK